MSRLCLVLILGIGCRSAHDADPPPAAAPATAAALEVITVIAKPLDATVRLPAELAPDETVAIFPRVTGFVDSVSVDRGSQVKKGQVLARLSAPEMSAQRAELASRVVSAKSTFDRLEAASKTPGAIAGHDLEVAKAALDAERSRVQAIDVLQSYLTVRAPFDGVITEREVHPGALVGPPSGANAVPLMRVENIDHLRVTVAVPEADVGTITEGGTAIFTVSTWPGEKFTGTIRRLSHVIDPKTRTMAVELDIANTGAKRLTPGAYAEVLWPVHRDVPSLFVPPTAVVQTPERTYVNRVVDGKVEQVTVQRGLAAGDVVEVFGTLAAGDSVLRRGSETLAPGAAVSTKPYVPPDAGPH